MSRYVLNGGAKMTRKGVTLKVESELYKKYREFCKKKGLIVSRQFEFMMEKQIKDENGKHD